MSRIIFLIFAVIFLIYMLWPEPTDITQFNPLRNSAKSTLSGDTTQIPNVSAYFSNNFRNFVIPFYKNNYVQLSHFPFPAIELNHPPEYSWTVIKKPTDATYLEEFVYPLKNSLYVNGFETNRPDGSKIFYGAPPLEQDNKVWYTKVTLRLYTSSVLVKLIVWMEVLLSIGLLYKLGRKVLLNES